MPRLASLLIPFPSHSFTQSPVFLVLNPVLSSVSPSLVLYFPSLPPSAMPHSFFYVQLHLFLLPPSLSLFSLSPFLYFHHIFPSSTLFSFHIRVFFFPNFEFLTPLPLLRIIQRETEIKDRAVEKRVYNECHKYEKK